MRDDGEGPDAVYDRQGRNVGANDTWWVALIPAQPAGTTVRFWATSYWKGNPPGRACEDREPTEGFSLYTVENTEARQVRVNEVLAINQTGLRNYRGFYEDWVELYNASDHEVDLAGLYLTANPRNPTRWAFPLSRPELTRIPAKGYILVWCDGQITPLGVRELHAPFRLNGGANNDDTALDNDVKDSRVYLANEKGVFDGIDWRRDPKRPGPCDLTADAQDPDISLGRVPDGGDALSRIIMPTPGKANPAGPVPAILSLKAAPDDPSCGIPCGSPSFVVVGENLANPARVLVDDGTTTIDAVKDVTADAQTLVDGTLLVPDDRCGIGARKVVWVYQGPPDALVAAKARFRCVPQITDVLPAGTQGGEDVTLGLCGFDVIQSVLIEGLSVPFTPNPRPGAAPKTVTFHLPPCEGTGRRIRVIDIDTYAEEICVCGACEGGARFVRGDADGDGRFTLGDPIVVLSHMFSGGSIGCAKTADLDDDGVLQLNDPIYLLSYLFSGGPPPKAPFLWCGADPTPDDGLSCETYVCR